MKRRLIVVGMLIAVFMTIIVFLVVLPSESYRRYQLEKVGDFSGPEYVADGSLFPSSLGVNPQLTIMATARHVAQQIISTL